MSRSELVKVVCSPDGTPKNPVEMILGAGSFDGCVTLEVGGNGSIALVNDGTFTEADMGLGNRSGIQAFLENVIFRITQHTAEAGGEEYSPGVENKTKKPGTTPERKIWIKKKRNN